MVPLLFLLFLWNGTVSSFRNALINRTPRWNRRAGRIRDKTAQTTTALLQAKESLHFIVLGGTGDLSMSKILPSLFDLYARKFLDSELTDSSSFLVQLVARSDWSTCTLHTTLMNRLTLPSDSIHCQSVDVKRAFVQRCSYIRVSSYHSTALAEAVLLSQPTASRTTNTIPTVSMNNSTDTDTLIAASYRRIVYFSLPPAQYLSVLQALHHHPPIKSDRAQSNSPVKSDRTQSLLELVLEKPVGANHASARVVLQVAK